MPTESQIRNKHIQGKKCRDFINKIKSEAACADCGNFYPSYVMDFDHVRGEKKFNVAASMHAGYRKLVAEIEKCDIVCSNCHRERTHQRKVAKQQLPLGQIGKALDSESGNV